MNDDDGRAGDRQARLGYVRAAGASPVPDARARARLLPGRRTRAGARVPLSRRRRRARNAAGLARSDARHRPRLGRHQAAAAAGRRARGARHAADRQDDRRAAREEARASPTSAFPSRIMDNTARGVLRALPPPRTLPFPLSLTLNPLARRFIAAQATKQVAQRARREHYPAPYAILDLWVKYDGDALAVPASRSGLDPVAVPVADHRQPAPRIQAAGAAEGPRQGGRLHARRMCTSSARARWAATSPRGARCAA